MVSPFESVAAGKGTKRQVLLGPNEGATTCAMRKFVMDPGGGMPLHTNTVEHLQYVLSGEAEIRIGTETIRVRAGDTVHIPAEVPHAYRVTSKEEFAFLCVIPNAPDKAVILE